ncbi:hypothetical protein GCM10010211_76780 [Streptomyces albospinus]|uniref:Transposase n=1 Tax=Streptomyces albospinus TaxID=285515 RepID=A0ABQ2VM46_9ACTN|nr:hypothetical protein GCM10010211_76780 [Streptomyces albospinus]
MSPAVHRVALSVASRSVSGTASTRRYGVGRLRRWQVAAEDGTEVGEHAMGYDRASDKRVRNDVGGTAHGPVIQPV